ncbi:hypothetical protein [Natronosalvus halobius]|uniref:hypothetical protein n=1 Tax=Natronosalvus halobius TaxID=2953746 RepID=UPI0020A23294|nr:hypothetical protein [Natronosalvus halobius]USZ70559.1 hypothetical protein NGM15_10615 [Natronosalvus halobius]
MTSSSQRVLAAARAAGQIAAVRHRVELRRRRRHPQLAAAVVLGATFATLLLVGTVPVPLYESVWPEPGAYHYGTLVGTESDRVLERTRELAATGLVLTAGLGALGATTSDGWETPPTEAVTAVPLSSAITGVLGAALLEHGWFVAPATLGAALAFTAGTGSPATLAGAVVGGGAILLTGLLAGTAVGVAIRAAIRRSPRLYSARYAVSVLLLFVTFVGLAVSRRVAGVLGSTPLGWYGDLALATTPGLEAGPVQAGAALLVATGVIPLALGTTLVSGRSLWFAETVLDDGIVSDSRPGRPTRFVGRALEARFGRATAGATAAVWRRMRRSPRAMLYVVLPLAFVGPVTADVSTTAPALLAPLVVLYAASAVGLGTTLNPLGNERVVLELVRTTPGGPDAILRGHALAALVPGVPVVATAALLVGAAAGYPPLTSVGFAVAATLVTIGGTGLSLAVGAYLPNLEGPTPASLSPPELYAMLVYLAAMVVVASPLFVGFGTEIADSLVGIAATVALCGVSGGVAGLGGYRYARRRLEAFEPGVDS